MSDTNGNGPSNGTNPSDGRDDITGPIPPVQPAPMNQQPQPQYGQRAPQPLPQQQPHQPWATPGQPYGSAAPAATAVAPEQTRSRKGAPWVAVPVAAVLAAALASGTTYALSDHDTAAAGSSTTKVVTANPADYKDGTGTNWSATAAKVTDSVVSIQVSGDSGSGDGSGVVLDTKGDIATNNHVASVAGSSGKITVTLTNNLTYTAKVVGTDPATDLAVIRLEKPPSGLKPISFADTATLTVGQPVMAVGNPLGLSGTVTTGIISALNRPVTTSASEGGSSSASSSATTNAIQTSAAINPGNSGGALVNASGQLIGINSSIATLNSGSSGSSQSGNIGIGFAIPVSVVKSITDQLISKGSVTHAQLGIEVLQAPGSVKVGDATESAAIVRSVKANTGASDAGLKAGDAIIAADGQQIVSSDALVGYVRAKTVGDTVVLTVVRNGKEQKLTVHLGKAS